MSKNWALVLVAFTFLIIGALMGTLIAARTVEAAKEPEKFAPPKIAYMNIAKVFQEFNKAKADGQAIAQKRKEFVDKAKPLQEELAAKGREIQAVVNPAEIEAIKKQAAEISKQLEELNAKAQKELGELTDRTIVEIYSIVRTTTAEIAKERGLDVIEGFADGTKVEDHTNPRFVQLKLQSPALIPLFLRKELDLTDELLERLNAKHPSK